MQDLGRAPSEATIFEVFLNVQIESMYYIKYFD